MLVNFISLCCVIFIQQSYLTGMISADIEAVLVFIAFSDDLGDEVVFSYETTWERGSCVGSIGRSGCVGDVGSVRSRVWSSKDRGQANGQQSQG